MNKSDKHYVNVGREGKPVQFVKIKDRKVPILTEPEGEWQPYAIHNVEKTLRFFHRDESDTAEVRIANFVYSLVKDCKEELELEDISRRIEQSMQSMEIIKAGSVSGVPLFLLRQDAVPGQEDADLLKRNEDIVTLLDPAAHSEYQALIQSLNEPHPDRLNQIEWSADLFALANPAILLLGNPNIVEKELSMETRLTRLYHENSKLHSFYQQGDFMKPLDEIDEEVKHFTTRGRKLFPDRISVVLPEPDQQCGDSIEEVVSRRRSFRNYTEQPVDLQTISNIMHYSYGITGRLKNTGLELRAVPSGGGLYPVDIYLAVNHVDTLESGIYYYDPFDHLLVRVNGNDLKDISKEVSGYSDMLDHAAFTIILAANFWRNQWKYHERGYRVILLDCGHVAQNLHLMCTAYHLGSCCLMGFVDNEINKLLELDGIAEHSMYLITVGKTAKG